MDGRDKKIRDALEKHFEMLNECAEYWKAEAQRTGQGVDNLATMSSRMTQVAALLLTEKVEFRAW